MKSRLTGVDATYIAQVANYLAGNSASLDVMGTTYSVDAVGMVAGEEFLPVHIAGRLVGRVHGSSMASGPHDLMWVIRDIGAIRRGHSAGPIGIAIEVFVADCSIELCTG